jgi:DNA-binding NtrC family response regulator
VAATNVDLEARVKAGAFRADLFFRLNVITIRIPPLRDRTEDIPALAEHFVTKYCRRLGRSRPTMHADAMRALTAYDWPGNVRELEHVIERALVLLRDGCIQRRDIPVASSQPEKGPGQTFGKAYAMERRQLLDEFDRRYTEDLLSATAGNVSEAARIAGLDRTNFRRMMRRTGVGRSQK